MLVVIETRVDRDVTEMVQEVTKQKKKSGYPGEKRAVLAKREPI